MKLLLSLSLLIITGIINAQNEGIDTNTPTYPLTVGANAGKQILI